MKQHEINKKEEAVAVKVTLRGMEIKCNKCGKEINFAEKWGIEVPKNGSMKEGDKFEFSAYENSIWWCYDCKDNHKARTGNIIAYMTGIQHD